VTQDEALRSHVMVPHALLKAPSQSQLVAGIDKKSACRLEHHRVSRVAGREPPLPGLVELAALRLV
jgi:hypothetical protein